MFIYPKRIEKYGFSIRTGTCISVGTDMENYKFSHDTQL